MKKSLLILIPILLVLGIIISCKKKEISLKYTPTGNVTLAFAHYVNGSPVQLDTMIYTNAAGNHYEVDDFRYFISDVQFHKSDGTIININDCTWSYYVDNTIPSTLSWNICDKLPLGTYDSISFRFGFSNSQNITNMFLNPPESNMFWPTMMGWGLSLYADWMENGETVLTRLKTLIHILVSGRVIYGSDTIYVDNSFPVKLPIWVYVNRKLDTGDTDHHEY